MRTTMDLRVSSGDLERWRAEAERHSLSLSAWTRLVLFRESKTDLPTEEEEQGALDARYQFWLDWRDKREFQRAADTRKMELAAWARLALNREVAQPRLMA